MEMKKWYETTFADDKEAVEDMSSKATFQDLFDVLDTYKDIYKEFNISDSVVRERLFTELALIIEMDYDYIYDQWLKGE